MHVPPPGWRSLSAVLGASGVAHFATPQPFARIVPRALGRPGPWVAGSGAAELACALGLLVPRARRAAGTASAVLLVAVFPANLAMASSALRPPRSPGWYRAAVLARLPAQVPLVVWALVVARSARSAGGAR